MTEEEREQGRSMSSWSEVCRSHNQAIQLKARPIEILSSRQPVELRPYRYLGGITCSFEWNYNANILHWLHTGQMYPRIGE